MRTTVQRVAAAVQERGTATLDDLAPLFPNLDREQIAKALSNAKKRGLIQLVVKGVGGPGKQCPGVWAAGHVRVGNYVQTNQMKRPPASAWELGEDVRVTRWPPTSHEGRQYQLLGSWTD